MSLGGKKAKVQCLVKFNCQDGFTKLCTLNNGLRITPKHPVMKDGKWVYPKQLATPQEVRCDAVYNLIVDQGHIAIVNETPLILLGHDLKEGILRDEYLGTSKVTKDLQSLKGWKAG